MMMELNTRSHSYHSVSAGKGETNAALAPNPADFTRGKTAPGSVSMSGVSPAEKIERDRRLADKRRAYQFGRDAENIAAEWLQRKGYEILARNYRTRTSEADLIVRQGDMIAIVEVKARSTNAYGLPIEAVTWRKQSRITHAAQSWLYDNDMCDAYVRFDVVEVYPGRIVHIRHAFEAQYEAA